MRIVLYQTVVFKLRHFNIRASWVCTSKWRTLNLLTCYNSRGALLGNVCFWCVELRHFVTFGCFWVCFDTKIVTLLWIFQHGISFLSDIFSMVKKNIKFSFLCWFLQGGRYHELVRRLYTEWYKLRYLPTYTYYRDIFRC